MTTEKIDGVSVTTQANVYFDGKCISHNLVGADGARKSVGVVLPSQLTFNTGAPERMEVVGGRCKIRLAGASEWQTYDAGTEFSVPGNSSFEIETLEMLDYVCHFE
jgi:uncharacterized protein YaiE (UPF0345 family)